MYPYYKVYFMLWNFIYDLWYHVVYDVFIEIEIETPEQTKKNTLYNYMTKWLYIKLWTRIKCCNTMKCFSLYQFVNFVFLTKLCFCYFFLTQFKVVEEFFSVIVLLWRLWCIFCFVMILHFVVFRKSHV